MSNNVVALSLETKLDRLASAFVQLKKTSDLQNAELQRQTLALAQKSQAGAAIPSFELSKLEQDFVSPHLQLEGLNLSERKQILSMYPEAQNFPKPILDSNGLGSFGINDPQTKKFITELAPAVQRGALDVARMSLAAHHHLNNGSLSAEQLCKILRDITQVSIDNAQIMAKKQLNLSLSARKAKGAESLADVIDIDDTNVIQKKMLQLCLTLKISRSSLLRHQLPLFLVVADALVR